MEIVMTWIARTDRHEKPRLQTAFGDNQETQTHFYKEVSVWSIFLNMSQERHRRLESSLGTSERRRHAKQKRITWALTARLRTYYFQLIEFEFGARTTFFGIEV